MFVEPKPACPQSDIVAFLPALRAFARRFYSNQSDADDLVQETVAKALANLDKFEQGTALKSWLFTIMRNIFCSRFAVARREAPGAEQCISDLRTSEPNQHWIVLTKEVESSCRDMPDHFRTVLKRIVIDGKSYEDVAGELGCAVGTVKSRLNRARHQLIDRFGSLDA